MLFEEKPNPVNYPNIAYDENACFQYSIDFTCTKNEDGTYTIIFNDDKYYDTKVVAVSNRQFLVYGDVSEGGENVCIDLPKDFEYAQNIDHYMVFVNGKKIDNNDLIFNFPKEDNPFPHISIYSTILFGDGDSVCVIYMPYSVKTTYKADSSNPNGIIKLNNLLPCGLNTENILLFINGYKVSNKEINIISDDVLQINSKYVNSTKNLSIIIPDILPALPVDLYKSEVNKFTVEKDGIRPPFSALTGFGEVDAKKLVDAREKYERFSSIEDMTIKAKLGKAAVETLRLSGCLDGMPRSEQMDIFDLL